MSWTNSWRLPIAPTGAGRAAVLAAGDVIAFLIFSAIGRASHAEAAGFGALLQIAETAAPFMAGWFVVAPLAGLFRADIAAAPRRMLARTSLAWLVALPIGLALRALIRQTSIPISFALVTFVSVLVILMLWRGLFALLGRRS
jgi:hypothetical protein